MLFSSGESAEAENEFSMTEDVRLNFRTNREAWRQTDKDKTYKLYETAQAKACGYFLP